MQAGARHRRDPQRDRHARRLRLVGRPRRRADAGPRGHRQLAGPARRGDRRGPRPPVHAAPRRQPLGALGRVVQLRRQRPRQRPRAALDGRDDVRPGRQRAGLRPPDLLVQALRRRPRLGTALGHFGAHYDEPQFLQHIVGGVQYAAGLEPGDCGGTINDSFEKVTLDDNTSAPFALDVAPDGLVFFTELVRGQVRVYNPADGSVKTGARRSTSTPAARTACSASPSTRTTRPTGSSTSTTRPSRPTRTTRPTGSAASPASPSAPAASSTPPRRS